MAMHVSVATTIQSSYHHQSKNAIDHVPGIGIKYVVQLGGSMYMLYADLNELTSLQTIFCRAIFHVSMIVSLLYTQQDLIQNGCHQMTAVVTYHTIPMSRLVQSGPGQHWCYFQICCGNKLVEVDGGCENNDWWLNRWFYLQHCNTVKATVTQ